MLRGKSSGEVTRFVIETRK